MVNLKVFPFHRCVVISKLTKDEVIKSLKKFVDQYGTGELFSNKYYGKIETESFSLYKCNYFFNTTLLKINGDFLEDREGNTLIRMTFLLSEHVFVFFLLSLIAFFVVFIIGLFNVEEFWWKIIPLILLTLDYLMVSLSFYFSGNDAKSYLLKKLNGEEITGEGNRRGRML